MCQVELIQPSTCSVSNLMGTTTYTDTGSGESSCHDEDNHDLFMDAVLKKTEDDPRRRKSPSHSTVVRVFSMFLDTLPLHDHGIARNHHLRGRGRRRQHSTTLSSTTTTATTTSSTLSPKENPRGRNNHDNKRRVSIDEQIQVRTTIARHEMSQDECDAVWYSLGELHQITESCCNQIIKLNRGETLKDKKYCARGLESFTHIRSIAKRMNRTMTRQVVFDEQKRQVQNGIHNEEALSRAYVAASSGSCLWWANNVVGLEDQKEADNHIDDDSWS